MVTELITSTRDGFTGLDYADQRFYASTYGRFNSPDTAAAGAINPSTWNRYAYVTGDPANRVDPRGLCGHQSSGYYDQDGGQDWDPFSQDWDCPVSDPGNVDPCSSNPYDAVCAGGPIPIPLPVPGPPSPPVDPGAGFGFAQNPDAKRKSLYDEVLEHLGKIEANPNLPDTIIHWKGEIKTFVNQIIETAEQVTKKRRKGAIDKYLQRIIQVSVEDLEDILGSPIIIIDPCIVRPSIAGCRRPVSGPTY